MTTADRQDLDMQAHLTTALRQAIRDRDSVATAALRSALAAIANAEAISAESVPAASTSSPHFAGAAAGLGAGEVARRVLSEDELADIIRAEIADRDEAAGQYVQAGHADRAQRLRDEASVLRTALISTALDSHR